MENDMKIPTSIQIGGQTLNTEYKDNLDGKLGTCCIAAAYIRLAKTFSGETQSESSLENTYVHEVVHAILDTMGRDDLSKDEVFVSTFAGFALEAIKSIHTLNNNHIVKENDN